ncbi:peptidylprolyl isomerase [Sphingomonas sp. ac-8]|uniref:peptidylprolyl isomerase n=1 Tax=Sphingomonas sp. ac-8 TaxID=3242977 RepID=UPI003A80F7DC
MIKNFVNGRRVRNAAALLLLAGVATASLSAQTVPDEQASPAANLNLPQNPTIFGKQDPNIRKATAIVNNTVLTGTDVDQRMALVVALNGIKLNDEDRDQLRLQIVRQLIDETLQIQEAKAKDITVTPSEIDQGFARVSRNFKRTPEQMRDYLRQVGASEKSMKRQIEGELAWSRLLRNSVEPFINVGEEEVQAILDRLEAAKGTEEYHLKEIYLSATPDRDAEVVDASRKIIEQIRKGAPFEYFASNFSEASTRAVQGDLGWIRLPTLPAPLAQAAQEMQVGQIAGPIQTPGGYSILFLADKRQVLMADPRDARLSLRQLTKTFPAGTSQAQATKLAAQFAEATGKIRGCGEVSKVASDLGVEVVDNDSVRIRDLPPALQELMLKLQVGEATQPFGSPSEGVRVLVLCGRDDSRVASLPSAEAVQQQVEQERVNLRAQRMLRDLRRDAIVEYR